MGATKTKKKKTHIIIHHSLTKDGKVVDWAAIRRYHMTEKGWSDIGYHYGVEQVADQVVIQKGRPEDTIGAHTVGMNEVGLGVCVVGNYDVTEPTEMHYKLCAQLCADLCKRHKIPVSNIETHHKYCDYKSCPGTKFDMTKLRAMVTKLLGGK